MSYYHLIIEARENLGKNDESNDIQLFNITDLKSLIPTVIRPYLTHGIIEIDENHIPYAEIEHFAIKQTQFPIEQLIEEEQKELPSNTDITITAYEIFNQPEFSHDVTQVILDLLDE